MRKIILAFVILAMNSCGQEHIVDKPVEQPIPSPTKTPQPGTGGERIGYQEMQGYLVTYCQTCHASAQFMSSEAALRASQAKNYLWSRRMPPSNAPKALPDNTRQVMLSFFQ